MNEGDLIQCNIDDCVSTTNKMTTNSNDDSILIASPPITPSINNNLADNLNQVNSEKCDISPENSKKSDDIDIFSSSTEIMDKISVEEQSISASVLLPEKSVGNEVLRIEEADDSARPAAPLAFTIDFGDTKNNVESQKKYQSMVERFQNRHKRGQSLSKLESPESDKKNSNPQLNKITRPPMSAKLPRKKQSIGTNSESSFSSEQDEQNFNPSKGSVKLRNRDRSVDSNKRHSWGPKTTGTVHANNNDIQPPAQHNTPTLIVKPIQQPIVLKNNTPSPIVHKKFTPRSTAMTMALDSNQNKLEFICPAPPLENYKTDRAEDSVSEAGTYTLDGDNYTEEQKAKMNIDKLKNEKLEIIDLDLENVAEPLKEDEDLLMSQSPRKNILEISFYHNEPTNFKPKLSYLEKIKSRVKNIGQKSSSKLAPPDKSVTSPDLGAFTSVTTSGILSLKPTLEHNPKMTRRNSLTKSHIDSSEYVQGISRLNLKCDDDLCDKPVAPRQIALDNNNDCDEIKILNCDNNSSSTNNNVNLGKTIKTASTKNDWIQEWAKYAREYAQNPSNKNAINPSAKQQKINLTSSGNGKMSQSYDFENYYNNKRDNNIENLSVMTKSSDYSSNYDDEFGHNLDRNNYNTNNNKSTKNNQNLERFNNIGSFEYSSSDTNLKYYDQKLLNNQQQRNDRARYDYVNRIDDDSNPNHNQRYHNTNNNINNHNYNSKNYQNQYYGGSGGGGTLDSPVNNRPPMSPSKIPSPIHSLSKARGSSRSRSRNGSNTDLNLLPNDTEMYLQKTAAAISTLQNIHRQNSLNNSPQSPSSPVRKISPKMSPNHHYNQHQKHNNQSPGNSGHPNMRSPLRMRSSKSHSNDIRMEHNEYRDYDDEDESSVPYYKSLHQRNLSLDGTELKPKIRNYDARHGIINMNNMSNSYNTDGLNAMLDMNKTHTRHHSYEGMSKNVLFDQTNNEHNAVAMRPSNQLIRTSSNNSSSNKIMLPSTNSPIRRSNSFSTKNSNAPPNKYSSNKLMLNHNINSNHGSNNNNNNNKHNPIKKSASSTSFRKMIGGLVHENDDEMEFYINDDDDLIDDHRYNNLNSSNSDLSDGEGVEQKEPITNTRYNKAFLMRMEQNKRPNSGNSGNPMMNKQGVIACPNTPELRRRDTTNVRQSFRDRASMPRDSSLSRMKQDLPNLNTTKKSLTSKEPKIQPKYLDISKYKPVQGNHFLKRDESKSYLAQQKEVKRSPSSASVNLNRNDNTRTSNRSIKSAGAKPNPSKKEQAIQKAKEIELAMWKRRASYDPMKAAAEGRKKQEEAKRQAQQSKLCESSVVLRSQSFHSGITGKTLGQNQMNKFGANGDDQTDENYYNKRWTLTSNESSDDDDDDEYLINS